MRFAPFVASAVLAFACLPFGAHAEVDWAKLNQELGRDGADQGGGVRRYSFPRSDLKVMLDGVELKAGLALGSWLAFQPAAGNDAMVVGDLVLTEEEINPVMKRLLDGGVQITAIHNHLLRAKPLPMYMHVEGNGDAVLLARTLRAALGASATPVNPPAAAAPAGDPGFNTEAIATALGRTGQLDGAVYKYSIARNDPIKERGMAVLPSLGTGIVINFQAAGAGKAATTGDFVLKDAEVLPVMRALKDQGIEVTALHSHMLSEEPRLLFMHFWAVDSPEKLGAALRKALDAVPTQQAGH